MAKRPSGGAKKRPRRGLWSPEEDGKLMNHIAKYGNGCWSSVPKIAGLERCGKSCRLRWINYLRPDLKRGAFSQEEEDLIVHLHSVIGNKWSQIAAQLPGRTDNEVKNFWNSFIKKKLRSRGIDPATHKPFAAADGSRTPPVFRDPELIMSSSSSMAVGRHQHRMLPPLVMEEGYVGYYCSRRSSTDGGGGCSDGCMSLSGYNQGHDFYGYTDADALHSGAVHPPAVPPTVIPLVSSSSTLNSMAGLSLGATAIATDEQCNNHSNSSGGGFESSITTQGSTTNHLPWLELGSFGSCGAAVDPAAGADHYGAAALDELRWSDYVFDGGYGQLQSYQQQGGQCIYGGDDSKDAAVQFDAHGLGNWCLN